MIIKFQISCISFLPDICITSKFIENLILFQRWNHMFKLVQHAVKGEVSDELQMDVKQLLVFRML